MSKNRKKQRPRFTALTTVIDESHKNPESGMVELSLHMDFINKESKVSLAHDNQILPSHSLISGYFGENKTRPIWEIPKAENDYSIDFHKSLERYDRLVAIDTNTKPVDNESLSIGIAGHLLSEREGEKLKWRFIPINHLFMILGNAEKIENSNWMKLIEFITRHENYNPLHKIALIVDSDLGEIDNYNKKIKPIIGNFYLPNNFELIYAGDKPNDSALNAAIKECHSISNYAIRLLEPLVIDWLSDAKKQK